MAKGPESKVQKKIQEAIKMKYPTCFIFKTHGGPYQQAGIPDLIASINGRFIGIEVKTPDKKSNTTKLQEHCIKQINDSGGVSFVSWSPEHAIEVLEILL